MSIEKQVHKKLYDHKRGRIFFPQDFSTIGSSQSIRQALNRLEKKDVLIRLAHGIYLYPKRHKILGTLLPTLDEIAQAISKRDKTRIMPTGIQALNKLGLSLQVPLNIVYLTDGSSRTVQIGNGTIKFKKATPKILSIKSETVTLVIQAMRELGQNNISPKEMKKIHGVLQRVKPNLLEHDLKKAPVWISELINSKEEE